MEYSEEEIKRLRELYKQRRLLGIAILIFTLLFAVTVTLIAFPSWELFGMPKLKWAPFFYVLIFGLIVSVAMVWKCPHARNWLGTCIRQNTAPDVDSNLNRGAIKYYISISISRLIFSAIYSLEEFISFIHI